MICYIFLYVMGSKFYSLFSCDFTHVWSNVLCFSLLMMHQVHFNFVGVPEHFMHKNRLQEYTQRSALPLPLYQTINEGTQHAPKFRASVLVDGTTYWSCQMFSNRKAAEQDVARVALEGISRKIKDEGCPIIREVSCIYNIDGSSWLVDLSY